MVLKILLAILGIFLFQAKCLDFTYLFQIKEYRFDRFRVFLNENGLFKIFYLKKIHLPAKSTRNMLLTCISFIAAIPLMAGVPVYLKHEYAMDPALSTTFLVIISPILSFISVAFAVKITDIFAQAKRRAIIDKATAILNHPGITTIGITGSYGKSTVKELVYSLIKDTFNVAKTDKNHNTDVGVAMSAIKNIKPDTRYFVAEMGAYRIGEIKNICDYTHPKFAIITALGNQHLALFGSKSNLVKAKKELAEALPVNGNLYISDSIDRIDQLIEGLRCRIVKYGNKTGSEAKYSINGNKIEITYAGKNFTLDTSMKGEHNLKNLVPAILLAIDLGVPQETIIKSSESLSNIEGKLSETMGVNGSLILNDVYSSNVEGFLAALEMLKTHPQTNKIVVTRGVIELGSEKNHSYRRINQAIINSGFQLLTTDKDFIKQGIGKYGIYFSDEDKLAEYIVRNTSKDHIILMEGRFPESIIKKITL